MSNANAAAAPVSPTNLGNPVPVANGTPPAAPVVNGTTDDKHKPAMPSAGKKVKAKTEPKSAADLADVVARKAADAAKVKDDSAAEQFLKLGWNPTETTDVELKSLTSEKGLQMRATGTALFDENTVENYKELIKDGAKFPAIKAIRVPKHEVEKHKLGGDKLIWDGHQTAEAAKRAGVKVHPVEIMDGTYRLARVLALGANRTHGKQRTDADKKRTFYAIVADPELLADAQRYADMRLSGQDEKGLTRALAFVSGVAIGSVSNYLDALGKTIRKNTIVDKPKPRTTGTGTADAAETTAAPKPETVDVCKKSAEEAVKGSPVDTVIRELERIIGAAEIRIANLAERPEVRDIVLGESAGFGKDWEVTGTTDGGQTVYAVKGLNTFGLMIEQIKAKWNAKKEADAAAKIEADKTAAPPAAETATPTAPTV